MTLAVKAAAEVRKPPNRCAACGQFTHSENGHAIYDVIDGTWEYTC